MGIERQTIDALDAVVLDPHPIWLDAVELVLGRIGATIVLKTSSSSEAVSAIERSQPRLLTLELDTPPGEPDGFEVMRRSRTLAPSLRAIVLSRHNDPAHIDAALAAGAAAYIVKTAHPDDVALAVRQAFDHSVYLAGGQRSVGGPPDPGIAAGQPGSPGRAHPPRGRDPPSRRRRPLQLTAGPHALGHRADGEVPPLERLSQARGRQPHRGKPVGAGERPARRRAEPRLRQPPTVRHQTVVFSGDHASADLGELQLETSNCTSSSATFRPNRRVRFWPETTVRSALRSWRAMRHRPRPSGRGQVRTSRQIQRVNRTISAVPGAL